MDITLGQRFRKNDLPYITWEVSGIHRYADALLYARLRRVDDRATVKTLSCATLQDPKFFRLVSGTP
jgi:hypothetical protein